MAKRKKIKVPINNLEDYLQLLNGVLRLTDTEIEVLAGFIKADLHIKKNKLDVNPFATQMKKRVAKELGRDDFNTLNNYIMRLKDKKAISPADGGYEINPILLPQGEQEITFVIE